MTPQISTSSSPVPGKQLWIWLSAFCALAVLGYPMIRSLTRHGGAPAPPVGVAALLDRSFEQYQSGKFSDSIVTAKQVLKLDPNSEIAYNNIAAAEGSMRMWDEAILNVREALRIRPGFVLAQNNLAWFTKAKNAAAASPAPVSPAALAHLNASLDHYDAGRYRQCIDEAREALKLNPTFPEAYNNIAAGYIGLGNWDEAIANAQESIRLKPDLEIAKNNLDAAFRRRAIKH